MAPIRTVNARPPWPRGAWTRRYGTIWLLACAISSVSGCADRAVDGLADDEMEAERPPRPEGESGAGSSFLYAACDSVAECGGLEYCLKPRGELGFCTQACTLDAAERCRVGDELDHLCRPVQGEAVCVLDCSDAACPLGMKCKRVDVDGDAESLCF